MKLKNIDMRTEELDKLLVHPRTEYKFRSTDSQIILREVSYFLNDPQTDELIWQLWKKYILKR